MEIWNVSNITRVEDCRATDCLEPQNNVTAPIAFQVFYYGLATTSAYLGNFLTLLVIALLAIYRLRIPDLLVGVLAFNDLSVALFSCTPSLIATLRREYFGCVFCKVHAALRMTLMSYSFALIVFMSVDRWLAITKPFYYMRRVSAHRMKVAMTLLFLAVALAFCVPVPLYNVVLVPGWYCTIGEDVEVMKGSGTYTRTLPYTVFYVAFNTTFIGMGMLILGSCTTHTLVSLCSKNCSQSCSLERRFAKVVAVIGTVFMATYLPYVISLQVCLIVPSDVCVSVQFWASRVHNFGYAVNPLVYGAMKPLYRRGYCFIIRTAAHHLSCGLIARPSQGLAAVFDTRDVVSINRERTVNKATKNQVNGDPHQMDDTAGRLHGSNSISAVSSSEGGSCESATDTTETTEEPVSPCSSMSDSPPDLQQQDSSDRKDPSHRQPGLLFDPTMANGNPDCPNDCQNFLSRSRQISDVSIHGQIIDLALPKSQDLPVSLFIVPCTLKPNDVLHVGHSKVHPIGSSDVTILSNMGGPI